MCSFCRTSVLLVAGNYWSLYLVRFNRTVGSFCRPIVSAAVVLIPNSTHFLWGVPEIPISTKLSYAPSER